MRRLAIEKIEPELWASDFAHSAHLAVFKEYLGEDDPVDVAMLATIDGVVAGYSTARHLGEGCLHLNYGGAVEPARGTPEILMLYKMLIAEYLKIASYLRTYVHNKNLSYLTLALREGFIVTGIRTFRGDTLLELSLDQGA